MKNVPLIVLAAVALAVSVWGGVQLWDTVVPTDLDLDTKEALGTFDRDTVEEAEDFEALLRWLFIGTQIVLVAVLVVYAKRGVAFIRESAAGPVGTGFLLGMLGLCIVWLVQLPFGVIEIWWTRKHDAVEVGYAEFLIGTFLALSGQALILCLTLGVAMGFALLLRRTWWLPGVAVLAGLTALLAWLSPYLIPGLDKPPADIAADARPLAREQGVEDVPVRVEDVDDYTEQPNAYAMGLGDTRRIVLWNTLVDDFERNEVRSVVSHEFGHLQHDHIAKSIGWFAVLSLPAALVVLLLVQGRGGLADPRAVPLALLVVTVLGLIASPLESGSSRRMEAEADWASLEATRDPASMEALHHRFTSEALSDPDPPGWFHWLFDSHPSGAERVAMARAWAEREE